MSFWLITQSAVRGTRMTFQFMPRKIFNGRTIQSFLSYKNKNFNLTQSWKSYYTCGADTFMYAMQLQVYTKSRNTFYLNATKRLQNYNVQYSNNKSCMVDGDCIEYNLQLAWHCSPVWNENTTAPLVLLFQCKSNSSKYTMKLIFMLRTFFICSFIRIKFE